MNTITTSNPQIVRLKAELPGKDMTGLVERVRAAAAEAGMPEPVAFESPPGSAPAPIERLSSSRILDSQVTLVLADGARLAVSTHPALAGSLVQASRTDDALTEIEVRVAQKQLADLLRALFRGGDVQDGHVERIEEGLDAVPSVPLARLFPAVVATERQVAAAYADPAPFWAAWDEDEVRGDRHLLSRHLEIATTAAWFRACFEDHWAMARAARPGDTFFGGLVAPGGCQDLLMNGESRVRQIGYRDGLVELAGFVPDGAHVPPWEILFWGEVLLRGALEDGSPVSALQVVFRDEEMARREATPFLDLGATVAFLGSDGLYHAVQ